jgi:hypothetical protein
LRLERKLGHRRGVAFSLIGLGDLARVQSDHVEARALLEKSLTIRRQLGEPLSIAASLISLRDLARLEADYVAARSLLEESLAIRRKLGDQPGMAASLLALGDVLLGLRDVAGDLVAERDSVTVCTGSVESPGRWVITSHCALGQAKR